MTVFSFLLFLTPLLSFGQGETVKDFYESRRLKSQVKEVDGLREGTYTEWYENGAKKVEGTYKKGIVPELWDGDATKRILEVISNQIV